MTAVRPLLDAILHIYPVTSPSGHCHPPSPPSPPPRSRRSSSQSTPSWNYPYPSNASRFLSKQIRHVHTPSPRSLPNDKYPQRVATDMSSPGPGRNRLSQSPSRHHGLTALSPLQAFSPLQPTAPLFGISHSRSNSDAGSVASSVADGSRTGSVTRSLSRRQSLIASAEKWSPGELENSRGDASSLFSRLTLVKAPAEGANIRR